MTLVTEKEAAEKWCPLYQAAIATTVSDGIEVVTNRNGINESGDDGKAACIGSRCMAFRWSNTSVNAATGERINIAPMKNDKDLTPRGYCGAFGKVEP